MNDNRHNWNFAPNAESDEFTAHNLAVPNGIHQASELTIANKLDFHIKFLVDSFFKHGHGMGFMLGAYLGLVCTSMENIKMVPRPPFIFQGSVVSADPTADPIRKLSMYCSGRGAHAGRAILKEIVYAVSNIGNPRKPG
ncbi:myosin 2 [Striga asiatica]|uniref:Myosin 2 n=1 Tax=Striga asiatica TaxID=4170 RepID=A0A5A7QPZ9_STRAF|nr:myosin 2 [Striga asiatica]